VCDNADSSVNVTKKYEDLAITDNNNDDYNNDNDSNDIDHDTKQKC
jgi:hypothetical protein